MSRPHRTFSTARTRPAAHATGRRIIVRGFSLIELLVVMSILALLVGILVPALSAARRAARSSACLQTQREIGQAVAAYSTVSVGYLPGPNTSGADLWRSVQRPGDGANKPVQSWDWVSPTLGEMLGLPDDPAQRYRGMFDLRLRCPANESFYDRAEGTSLLRVDPLTMYVGSYSSPIGFQGGEDPDGHVTNMETAGVIEIPAGLDNRLDVMGPPATKMWAMDGVRHIGLDGSVRFDCRASGDAYGGNFMTESPALASTGRVGSPYRINADGEPAEASLRAGYRHSGKMNGVFLDGHADSMDHHAARYADYYFPTGSRIIDPTHFTAPLMGGQLLR